MSKIWFMPNNRFASNFPEAAKVAADGLILTFDLLKWRKGKDYVKAMLPNNTTYQEDIIAVVCSDGSVAFRSKSLVDLFLRCKAIDISFHKEKKSEFGPEYDCLSIPKDKLLPVEELDVSKEAKNVIGYTLYSLAKAGYGRMNPKEGYIEAQKPKLNAEAMEFLRKPSDFFF